MTPTSRTPWRGRALVVIASIHCAFTLAMGSTAKDDPKLQPYVGTELPWTGLHPGFGSDLPPQLWLLALVWSIFCGVALALLGVLVHTVEREGRPIGRGFSVALLAFALVGGVLMPVSGFWLVALVAAALLRRP